MSRRTGLPTFLHLALGVMLVMVPMRAVRAQGGIQAPGTCDTGTNLNADCRMLLTITSTIQATRRLVVTPGSGFALTPASGALTVADFDAGMFNTNGSIGLTIQSNAPWRVTVQASAATMSGACGGKNTNTITWGTTTAARSTPLSTAITTVASGTTFTASRTENVFLRVAIGWVTDAPVAAANCTLPLSFQITAP
ncbi:hypothetical protein [Gemmatimonas sp.]|jgi:hypothetical protein|uniref:hypothetical protein n=1 Tax=Gemmatimonas sp. TaxID=1962908 RepID=UPI0037BEA625